MTAERREIENLDMLLLRYCVKVLRCSRGIGPKNRCGAVRRRCICVCQKRRQRPVAAAVHKSFSATPKQAGMLRSPRHHGLTVGGGTGVIGVLLLPAELATTTPVTVPTTAAAAATTSIVFCVLKNPVLDCTLA